jgi:hypothetical protein
VYLFGNAATRVPFEKGLGEGGVVNAVIGPRISDFGFGVEIVGNGILKDMIAYIN